MMTVPKCEEKVREQGDQMARLFNQSLAIYIYENMPNSVKKYQFRIKILPSTNKTLAKFPKACKILPKWRKFAKSGHTITERERESKSK